MNIIDKFRQSLARALSPIKNSIGDQFLRFGSKMMSPGWTDVELSDKDHYTGYGYAAIRNRANMTASIAIDNVRTDSKKENFVHPYLDLINKSNDFSHYKFWSDISTFLDLEGVYYLMAIRTVEKGRVGNVQSFKLLNPYNIRRVRTADKMEIKAYIEARNGYVREIQKEMIIDMRELNPFSEDLSFAMTDAARESQFTLKTSGDYTRHALKNNINAPGILSTDIVLEEKQFENFMARVRSHAKGEPIFGNGQGAITWESMQIELGKSGMKDLNEMNRDELLAVSGVSKTMMGIEQSGVTRETSKIQKDLSIEGHIIPRIQLIIDCLNQDYKKYSSDYKNNLAEIVVDNPTKTDLDASVKETELKEKQFDLYSRLINRGVKKEIAAEYIKGNTDLDKIDIKPLKIELKTDENNIKKEISKIIDQKKNEFQKQNNGLIQQQQGSLQNAVVNIQGEIVASAIARVSKIAFKKLNKADELDEEFNEESDIVSKRDKKSSINELTAIMTSFYGIIMMLHGGERMRDNVGKFDLDGDFTLDKKVKDYIKKTSGKVSESHIDTISEDIYQQVRKDALAGLSQEQIISNLKNKYATEMVETDAKRVARTETNRAFTRAQYEADRQFVDENDLTGRVYKQWKTRSDNPCEFCQELENEGPVLFGNAFRDLGDTISVGKGKDKKTLDVAFEELEAGNAHPNCSCEYELIIRD